MKKRVNTIFVIISCGTKRRSALNRVILRERRKNMRN